MYTYATAGIICTNCRYCVGWIICKRHELPVWKGIKIRLKPISDLKDEHALKVSELVGGASHLTPESQIIQAKRLFESPAFYVNQTNIKAFGWLQAFQFLQSKGYDLPHYLLSGKTLQEAGLAIYESDEK